MNSKKAIKSQYYATLAMLKDAIIKCPASCWDDQRYRNKFWHIAYHALFYTHLYLQTTEQDFVAWEKHEANLERLGAVSRPPFSKKEILEYYELCCQEVAERVDTLDLGAESGFHWLSFDKLELQFYNIRHTQHHVGQLYDRLTAAGQKAKWVGTNANP